jgi:cyclopropane-fatty-acyl-phospholipid synthase
VEAVSDTRVAEAFANLIESDSRIRLIAYDGSVAGREDAPVTLDIRSESAVRYIATAPSDLGLARAFVSGELELSGDLHLGLTDLLSHRLRRAMSGRQSLRDQ